MWFILRNTTVCLCNINWICGRNMVSVLNGFYYHSFHLTTSLIGNILLCSLLQNIKQNSPAWYAIIGDEALRYIANREQLNISIRWVNESYEISEDPVGLFCLTNTTADAICDAIKDILIRCSLPLSLCRSHTYDGASKRESPSALSVHCFAHKLNLCLQDVGKQFVFL